jgi:hypothetical protein
MSRCRGAGGRGMLPPSASMHSRDLTPLGEEQDTEQRRLLWEMW